MPSVTPDRAAPAGPAAKHDAMADFNAILAIAGTRAQTAAELADMLHRIYGIAANADLNAYDFASIRRSASGLSHGMHHLRLALRDQIPDWQARGLMTETVQAALRDVFRVMRYGADLLGELAIDHQKMEPGEQSYPAFSGPSVSTFYHARLPPQPELQPQFRSGDVLLVRGRLPNSAAIARIGDIDSQFSHICMLHVGRDGTHNVVESLIEDGAIITPLDKALKHGIGRAVLFRHKDSELAARSADLIHAHVARSHEKWFGRIRYDFTMRLTGTRRLFCSKLVRQAFEMGSGGRVQLPTYTTKFANADMDFMRRIGVEARETFAPGDIELESDFDMVAEWADHRVTSELRTKDMVLSKMFEWMEDDGWRFEEDWRITMIGWFGRFAAHFSDGVKTMLQNLVPRVPINMPRRTIATVAMLHKTAMVLVEQLEPIEQAAIASTGHPLHGREILERIEGLRATSGGRIGYLVAPKVGTRRRGKRAPDAHGKPLAPAATSA